MSYPSYPEYQDSGIDWLGMVPAGWQINRLKDGGNLVSGIGFPHDFQGLEGEEYQFYKVGDLESSSDGKYMSGASNTISATTLKILRARSIPAGSILWAKIGAALLLNRRRISTVKCCIDNNMTAYVPNSESIVSDWAYYWTSILDFGQVANPGAVPSLGEGYQEILPLLVPPRSEQTQIARFLDHQTARIDALIAEQQRLIELLKEKRQAVISHAVTKGLDSGVAMKDSGVEWLGEVPSHWEVRKLSTVTDKITNGYVGPTRDLFVDDGIPYLQSLHIKNNQIIFSPEYYVPKSWSDEHSKSILKPDDVLIVQTGDIGQIAVVPDDFPEANCHALIVTSTIKQSLSGSWLAWVFLSDYGYNSLMSIKTGALHPHLNCGYVKDIYIPVPPPEEQTEIINHLSYEEQGHQKLLSQAQSAIGLLQERRSALISAAVTGKIDVRDWQPPSSEAFPEDSVSEGATA